VAFTIEVDPTGGGDWQVYRQIRARPGETSLHEFPEGYSAHWVRVRAARACRATAMFAYY
jgi:hypothetical protein